MSKERTSIFTVRDAESSIVTFSVSSIVLIILVYLYHFIVIESGFWISLNAVFSNMAEIVAGSTLIIILKEGLDIMFMRRYREAKRRHKEAVAEGEARGEARGRAEGRAEALAKHNEWVEWANNGKDPDNMPSAPEVSSSTDEK